MTSLEEAIATGQGNERPFNCPVHGDANASASVNILKGVWFCFACQESGRVDSNKAPTAEALASMIKPEKVVRVYPESWLDLFDPVDPYDGYWTTRFDPWVAREMRLGIDPFTGSATFPVRTSNGRLAGVGRRAMGTKEELKEAGLPRYLYPSVWSASTALCTPGKIQADDILVLVEGAADTTSLVEVGIPVAGCWGAGLHYPQRELVLRRAPKLVLAGFDMDEAGEKAVSRLFGQMKGAAEVKRVRWDLNDPAESPPEQRREAVLKAVSRSHYAGNLASLVPAWDARVRTGRENYQQHLEDDPWHHLLGEQPSEQHRPTPRSTRPARRDRARA